MANQSESVKYPDITETTPQGENARNYNKLVLLLLDWLNSTQIQSVKYSDRCYESISNGRYTNNFGNYSSRTVRSSLRS